MILDLSTLKDGSPVNGVQTNRAFCKCVSITSTTGLPTEYTISTAAIAVNDVTATLTLEEVNGVAAAVTDSVYLDKGTILTFGANSITLAANVTVTDGGDAVAIFPAAAIIADGTETTVFGLVRVPVAEIGNWNQVVANVDTKTLGFGEQSQMERVSVQWTPNLNLIIPPNDVAFYKHILPSCDNFEGFTGRLWLFMAVPTDNAGSFEYGVGPALVSISSDPVPKNEVRRPVIQAEMQYPYIKTTRYDDESAARQALIEVACATAGVAVPA
jgi:hypothetical protein